MSKTLHHLSCYMRIFVGCWQMLSEDKALCNEEIFPHDVNDCLTFCCVNCRLHFFILIKQWQKWFCVILFPRWEPTRISFVHENQKLKLTTVNGNLLRPIL